MMNLLEYQRAVLRTCGVKERHEQIQLAALGIAGEAGEVADLVKKVTFHSHDYDEAKFCEELGDVLWYIALMCTALQIPLQDVIDANIEKLRKRYPDGFDVERSKNREE